MPNRTLIAFVVAPLCVPIILLLASGERVLIELPVAPFVAIAASYFAMFAFGAPAFGLLKARGQTGVWASVISGLSIGLIVWNVFWILIGLLLGETVSVAISILVRMPFRELVVAGLAGACAGLVFWVIARPDRSPNGPPS